jgi:tRNA (guanine26-N2/guanine27-N2)-dimethyltransferase
MAASGIRSIRYAKELTGVESIVANDYSQHAVESIQANSVANGTTDILVPSCNDCK